MIRQRGFTLLEISIAMIIMAAMAAITTRAVYLKLDTRFTEHTAAEVWVIGEYAQKYIQQNGEWPDQTNSCGGAIALMTASLALPAGTIPFQSPWETNYVTSCNAVSFSIEVQLDDNWAPAMMNMLAVTQMKGGTTDTTITTLPMPGSISALQGLLHRTDTGNPDDNKMETDLNMGYFDIANVETISAKRLDVSSIDSRITINALSGAQNGDPVFALNAYGKDEYGMVQPSGSEPRKKNGSINVNDIYLRSVGGYISSRLPDMVEKTSYIATGGDLVPKPSCPHNSTVSLAPIPKIRVRPATDYNTAVDFGIIDDVEYWEVRGGTVSKAEVYCYYPPLVDPGYEEVIPVGQDLEDLVASGDLEVNNISGSYTYYYNTNCQLPRNSWVNPVYVVWFDGVPGYVDPGWICPDEAPPIVSVNNIYVDRWISFDISMTIQSSGGDNTSVRILVGGTQDFVTTWGGGSRTINHTVVVNPGENLDIKVQGQWHDGGGVEEAKILSMSVNKHIHISNPAP